MVTHHLSRLAGLLSTGRFAVTTELAPPRGTDTSRPLGHAEALRGLVDAINVTDNQNARLKLSPLAFARLLVEAGHEPIFQLTCRDRNRLALQSDLLGAWTLGVRNVLALTGDHVTLGDHPDARPVFDLDAVQLLDAVQGLNAGHDLAGNPLRGTPTLFAGAALACEQQPLQLALLRFRKKAAAGARFFQTQALFSADPLLPFAAEADGLGVPIIAGVLVLHSAAMVDHVVRKVPGLRVPTEVARRIREAADPAEAGLSEAARIVAELRPHCAGVHLMAAGREDLVVELIRRLGRPPATGG